MTATVEPRCLCAHSAWRHVRDTDRCRAPGCVCRGFRDAADELGDAITRHPAGTRTPAHLTGSQRRGGGDPMSDYRHLKGEL